MLDRGSVTRLTKRQFRFLLLIYCVLIVAGLLRSLPGYTPLTTTDFVDAKRSFGLESLSDSRFRLFMIWLLGTVLVTSLVGLVSLFWFWRPGVYVFLAAVCARLVIEHLSHLTSTSGWWLY